MATESLIVHRGKGRFFCCLEKVDDLSWLEHSKNCSNGYPICYIHVESQQEFWAELWQGAYNSVFDDILVNKTPFYIRKPKTWHFSEPQLKAMVMNFGLQWL